MIHVPTDEHNKEDENKEFENIFSKYNDLTDRCDKLDAAVKLINDLNELSYQLSESFSSICDAIDSGDREFIEKIVNVLVWLSSLNFPLLHKDEREYNDPQILVGMMTCDRCDDQRYVDILKRMCDKYGVDVNEYV